RGVHRELGHDGHHHQSHDLYASSTNGQSYFAGNVGIGTKSPTASLQVAGNLKVSGAGHGITYQDGTTQTTAARPGPGTVTSVGSGAGLAGGPITSKGTLSIAAAGVADAMLASAYSGTGSCAAGQFVVSLGRAAAPGCGAGNSGTVTSVGSGAGLTGGPITASGTLSIPTGGVTSAMLVNPSLTVATPTGSGLSGGSAVPLGGTVTLTNTGILGLGVSAPIKTTGGQSPTLSIATAGVK